MYQDIFAVIAPIFICSGIGFFWYHQGWPYDGDFVAKLVMLVGAPCLILSGLTKVTLDSEMLAQMLAISLLAFVLMLGVCIVCLKLTQRPLAIYLPSMVFPNTGNMGLPICLLAFGQDGLALALIFFVASSLLHFSFGVALVSRRSWHQTLLRTPIIYAAGLALLVVFFDWQLPKALSNSLDLLGGFSIPLMLIALGVSLAKLSIGELGQSLFIAFGRLGLGALVAGGLIWGLELDGLIRSVLIVQMLMPAAVFNYLIAQQYQQGAQVVAGSVVLSTLISFISLPVLLWFAA